MASVAHPPVSAASGGESAGALAVPAVGGALSTLRAKGFIALALLSVYVAAIALYVSHDRQRLLHIVQQLEHLHDQQESLVKVNAFVAHSIVAMQLILDSGVGAPRYEEVSLDFGAIRQGLPDLKNRHPEIAPVISEFELREFDVAQTPTVDKMMSLRDVAQRLNAKLEGIESLVAGRSELLLFGAVAAVFFTKLASDIRALETRALAIVGGYRGEALQVTRRDEVGRLMHAINRTQSILRDWERQREISRQKRFHQEKMAAVGSVAAAVVHEVSNPLAAIAGIAQRLVAVDSTASQFQAQTVRAQAQLILDQTQRIASIMRQVTDLRGPSSPEPELLDFNGLVGKTCSFVGYDGRFQGIDLITDLEPDMAAVRTIADHLTQVLMNLLINAADAMEGIVGRRPRIVVATRVGAGEVIVTVADNGCGMEPEVQAQAFEEWFSTKPADRGRGIGLFLCKALIEQNGGRIELESTPGEGTVARVFLPAPWASVAIQRSE
jgi:two-component system, NtrC family, sensor kinase